MKPNSVDRREFIKTSGNAAAGMMVTAALPVRATSGRSTSDSRVKRSLKFSVIGVNHDHIYAQVEAARRGGGELVSFTQKNPSWSPPSTSIIPTLNWPVVKKKY